MNDQAFDLELDCQGELCPLPILKTKKAIDSLASGQVLKMISTDLGSINDIAAWTRQTGHVLVHSLAESGVYTYYLRKT